MNKTLKNAVIRRVGKDSLRDVYNHGADAGYPGFTYYTDTCKFFRTHKKAIIELAEEIAGDAGENFLDMIKGFRALNGDYTTSEIAQVLYGPWKDTDHHTAVGNIMAWFALEEVAREVYDK